MNSIHLASITADVKKAVAEVTPGQALWLELYSLKAEVFGVMVATYLEMKDAHSKMTSKADPRAFSVNVGLLTCEKKHILKENSLNIGCTLTIMTMTDQVLPEYRAKTVHEPVALRSVKQDDARNVKQENASRPIKQEVDQRDEGTASGGRGGQLGRGLGGGQRGGGLGGGRRRDAPPRRSIQEAKDHYGGSPCALCGGYGHQKKNCHADNSSMKCYRCGGWGHPASKCASSE